MSEAHPFHEHFAKRPNFLCWPAEKIRGRELPTKPACARTYPGEGNRLAMLL